MCGLYKIMPSKIPKIRENLPKLFKRIAWDYTENLRMALDNRLTQDAKVRMVHDSQGPEIAQGENF